MQVLYLRATPPSLNFSKSFDMLFILYCTDTNLIHLKTHFRESSVRGVYSEVLAKACVHIHVYQGPGGFPLFVLGARFPCERSLRTGSESQLYLIGCFWPLQATQVYNLEVTPLSLSEITTQQSWYAGDRASRVSLHGWSEEKVARSVGQR